MNMILNTQAHPISVTTLNHQVKRLLEEGMGVVAVEGEVSSLSRPASGHAYFSLKDSTAQIRCVFFKGRHRKDTADILKQGAKLVLYGTLSLYEARGDYQLIVEAVEPQGIGDLFQQFEALKQKLSGLGLFDAARKKSWPRFPSNIALITSPTGAAIRDMLSTLNRRFPLANIYIYPSEVQGDNAPTQLVSAIQQANRHKYADVIILARGGGSIEDLWAFNDEQLAYAIAESELPIISGVGHETDFTIADFVADYRAPTPTAAAEAVTPDKFELLTHLEKLETRLLIAITRLIRHLVEKLASLTQRLTSPKRILASHWQTIDYLSSQLASYMQQILAQKKHVLQTKSAQLNALSPLATLARGYSIATCDNHIVKSPSDAPCGQEIRLVLNQDAIDCEVIRHVKLSN